MPVVYGELKRLSEGVQSDLRVSLMRIPLVSDARPSSWSGGGSFTDVVSSGLPARRDGGNGPGPGVVRPVLSSESACGNRPIIRLTSWLPRINPRRTLDPRSGLWPRPATAANAELASTDAVAGADGTSVGGFGARFATGFVLVTAMTGE